MAKFSQKESEAYSDARIAARAKLGEAWSLNDIKAAVHIDLPVKTIRLELGGEIPEPTVRLGSGEWGFYDRQDANRLAKMLIEVSNAYRFKEFEK